MQDSSFEHFHHPIAPRPHQPVQDAQEKIDRTITFMKANYESTISREQLASIAGLNPEHYSRMFRKYTGKRPMDYLAGLRMNLAKELLQHSTLTIVEIGQRVGYNDPYHFSRRFKQIVGVAPVHYAQSGTPKVIALNGLGHCQALGITPIAAATDHIGGYVKLAQHEQLTNISNALYPQLDKSLLQQLHPTSIITANEQMEKSLSDIASIIRINVLVDPIYTQLFDVANALNREKQAKEWVAQYDARCKVLRTQLFGAIGGARVAILRVREQLLQVYGMLNMGYPLYQSLQLAPPEKIAMQCMCNAYFHSSVITIEELPFYEAEHLFIVLQPDEGAYKQWNTIIESEAWKSFLAVRLGHVYHLDVANWLDNDPVSIQKQMEEAARLLTS